MSLLSFLLKSASSFSQSSSRFSGSIKTKTKDDVIVFLDRDSLDAYLPNWKMMESYVEMWFLGRAIDYIGGQNHWPWLLIGSSFFCTIEFGGDGIVIQYFKKQRGFKTVCKAIMANENIVYYSDKYTTWIIFTEILQYVVETKSSWRADDYHGLMNNCRDFVRVLGRKLDSNFLSGENVLDLVFNDTAISNKCINIA